MASDDDTFISPPDKDKQEVLRDRACELGFIEKEQASELFEEYRQSGMKANFDSFLLARGVVSVEQVDELHPEEASSGPPSTERFDRDSLLGDAGTGVSDGSTSFLAAGADDGFGSFDDDGFDPMAGVGLWYTGFGRVKLGGDLDFYVINNDPVYLLTAGVEFQP